MVGASFDTPAENKAFRDKFSYPFPLLCDTEKRLGLAYGACADASVQYPDRVTVVVDAKGVVAKVYRQVQPKTHPDEVLADLKAMSG